MRLFIRLTVKAVLRSNPFDRVVWLQRGEGWLRTSPDRFYVRHRSGTLYRCRASRASRTLRAQDGAKRTLREHEKADVM
jgi:hypothetical protein